MKLPSLDEFIRYAETYEPFSWELTADNDFQPLDIRGKHSVLVSLVRFWKIILATKEACPEFKTVIDVGPYPGSMIKMLRHFFPHDFRYFAIGLGLSPEYCLTMEKFGGYCFESELDPDFVGTTSGKEWPFHGVDCALLLDVIEHLSNPVPCLDNINRALDIGGTLVLTTDNLTSFANAYQMLRRGISPNIHPLRSSQFFCGDWRPHFREFSIGEIEFYLEHSGFSITRHEFFERRQGDYFFDSENHIGASNRYRGVKGLVQRAILGFAPHLKDHHLVVATKVVNYEQITVNRPKPTSSMAEWLKLCSQAGV